MEVVIVGEDKATREILYRIINYVGGLVVKTEMPARGGKIKSLVQNFNKLSKNIPVILLTDLDQFSCAPELISDCFREHSKNVNFHFRVAVDEAEAWLMADREGFSKYFGVPLDKIPVSTARSKLRPSVNEMDFPYKSSLYLMKEIAPYSNKKTIREDLAPKFGSKKGILYNSTIVPFIKKQWDIDNATKNSYSLRKIISRLTQLSSD